VDISHILIRTGNKTDEEALAVIASLNERLAAGEDFNEMAKTETEDTASKGMGGRFKSVKRGEMVPEFEAAAFELAEGEVSELVKTQYGYHLIKKHAHHEAAPMSFDKVQIRMVEDMRKREFERRREDIVNEYKTLPFDINEEAVANLRTRYQGGKIPTSE